MHADADVLGSGGRKAIDACVKVKIIGKPVDTQRYSWGSAVTRLRSCYAVESGLSPTPRCEGWLPPISDLLLPPAYDDEGNRNKEKTYDILKIYEALKNFDEKLFVEKDPSPAGPRCDELKKLIDEKREGIKEEYDDASARVQYSWQVAQRRVRDCYAGNFPDDRSVLFNLVRKPNEFYNIIDIYAAVLMNKESPNSVDLLKDPSGPGSEKLKKSIEKNISAVQKEYEEARRMIKCYSREEAQKMVDCAGCPFGVTVYPSIKDETGEAFYIFDIYKFVSDFHVKQPDILNSIRDKYKSAMKILGKYSRSEAERRVRDCFPGTFVDDTNIFPHKKKSYNISDIQCAIDRFDQKKLLDQQVGEDNEQSKKWNQKAKDQRKQIEEEYAEAMKRIEIEHGSGFIINDHYVITNKHVIDDAEGSDIFISNASIGELSCETAHTDCRKDLALLYCQKLEQYQVTPLYLSNEPLLPGMKVFSFGYPMSHPGKTALFVGGYVSGSKETYSDDSPSLVVLNLSLNSGNSGGPILCWVANQLKVVGVAVQKHFKRILKFEEMKKIEEIRESLRTSSICRASGGASSNVKCPQIPLFLLTLKLYDALETHSQFNLSNAIPGHCVIEFINEIVNKPGGEHKDELTEVVKWSADSAK